MDTSSTNSASSRFPPDITKSEVSTTASDKKIGVAVSSYAPSYKRKESDNVVRNGTTERPSTFRPVIPTSTFSPGQKNSEDGKPPNKVNEIVNVMNNRREFIVKAVPKDEAKPYDVHLHQNQSQSSASSGADKDKIKKAPPSKPAKPVIEPKPVVKTKVRKEITGYVGFANLPNQVHRKAARKGFEFTVMVIGETGIGKSTLVNSMFMTNIYSVEYPSPSLRVKETVEVETTKVLLTEKGVKLSLTIVDTPGFGDAIDNSNSWQCLSKFVDERYEEYLRQESRVNREPFPDTRVNCCLYFISPNGRRLRPVDVECMKELHDKVNIIPIIAKADTLTPEEVADFKKEIMREIQAHKIRIYDFPPTTLAASGEQPIKDRVPFAIVGANTYHEVDGKRVLGRRYPWGVVDVQNMEHCDFLALRDVLIRTHLIDLKEVTDELHYENFRIRRLGPGTDASLLKSSKNPLAQMEHDREAGEARINLEEQQLEEVFRTKVEEKKQKLKDHAEELEVRRAQMKSTIDQQRRELDEKRRQFEAEVREWEQSTGNSLEDLRRRSIEAASRDGIDGGKEEKHAKKKKKGIF